MCNSTPEKNSPVESSSEYPPEVLASNVRETAADAHQLADLLVEQLDARGEDAEPFDPGPARTDLLAAVDRLVEAARELEEVGRPRDLHP